jgi:hypothetical protein
MQIAVIRNWRALPRNAFLAPSVRCAVSASGSSLSRSGRPLDGVGSDSSQNDAITIASVVELSWIDSPSKLRLGRFRRLIV